MNKYQNYREFLNDLILWGDCVCAPLSSSGREPSQNAGAPDIPDWEQTLASSGRAPKAAFSELIKKAAASADCGSFSPFLFLALAARLEWPEMLLLAAALYTGLTSKILTPDIWQLFLAEEKGNLQDETKTPFLQQELFHSSAPLLYEREWDKNISDIRLRIVPRIFLFLKGILAEPIHIPGLNWYSRKEDFSGRNRLAQTEDFSGRNQQTQTEDFLGGNWQKQDEDFGQLENSLPYLGKNIRLWERIASCISEIPGQKLVYLNGPAGSGRKLNYAYLAAFLGKTLAVISLEQLESQSQLHDIQTECLLNHAMFVFELPEEETDLSLLLSWLPEEETVFLLGEKPNLAKSSAYCRQYLPFAIHSQDVLRDKELYEQLTLSYQWEQDDVRADFLGRYNFLPGRMREILELAKSYSLSAGIGLITGEHLRQAVLGVSSHSLERYDKKIRGVYQMKDLILPDLPKQKLFHIINRVRNRKLVYEEWGFLEKSAYGNGVSMIFAGPPGTGKTMAAQVMAGELDMELYRVELPAVVDKYIGETEKKLNRIFGEAEKTMAILFFDEADALFSKRTEIKESNDKYSNMEIAFLLQKMEEYEGISILATNYLQNFDGAFRRRVSDIIDFPLPGPSMRQQMWQSMIPAKLPVSEEVDFRFLGEQFEVSGSAIKNSLIYAGFLAAEAAEPLLTMERILKGLSHELEKSGKKLSRKDYGEYGHLF